MLEEELRPVGPLKRMTRHYRVDLLRVMNLLFPPDHTDEGVSGTRNSETGTFSTHVQVNRIENPVSGTGNSETGGVFADLQDERPETGVSGMHESTPRESTENNPVGLSAKTLVTEIVARTREVGFEANARQRAGWGKKIAMWLKEEPAERDVWATVSSIVLGAQKGMYRSVKQAREWTGNSKEKPPQRGYHETLLS